MSVVSIFFLRLLFNFIIRSEYFSCSAFIFILWFSRFKPRLLIWLFSKEFISILYSSCLSFKRVSVFSSISNFCLSLSDFKLFWNSWYFWLKLFSIDSYCSVLIFSIWSLNDWIFWSYLLFSFFIISILDCIFITSGSLASDSLIFKFKMLLLLWCSINWLFFSSNLDFYRDIFSFISDPKWDTNKLCECLEKSIFLLRNCLILDLNSLFSCCSVCNSSF